MHKKVYTSYTTIYDYLITLASTRVVERTPSHILVVFGKDLLHGTLFVWILYSRCLDTPTS